MQYAAWRCAGSSHQSSPEPDVKGEAFILS